MKTMDGKPRFGDLVQGYTEVKTPYRKALDGYTLKPGDIIICKNMMGTARYQVHRVTKKYAFVKYSAIAEGRFPIVYGFRFQSLPREKWCTTEYTVLEKIKL